MTDYEFLVNVLTNELTLLELKKFYNISDYEICKKLMKHLCIYIDNDNLDMTTVTLVNNLIKDTKMSGKQATIIRSKIENFKDRCSFKYKTTKNEQYLDMSDKLNDCYFVLLTMNLETKEDIYNTFMYCIKNIRNIYFIEQLIMDPKDYLGNLKCGNKDIAEEIIKLFIDNINNNKERLYYSYIINLLIENNKIKDINKLEIILKKINNNNAFQKINELESLKEKIYITESQINKKYKIQKKEPEIKNILKYDNKEFEDLKDELTFTIDGNATHLFDDAFSITKYDSDSYLLKIFVADVSSFVKPYSAIDKYAYKNAESIYLHKNSIHMMPSMFTDNLSLNEHFDRLCIKCEVIVDKNLRFNLVNINRCVINISKNLHYSDLENLNYDNYSKDQLKKIKLILEFAKTINLNDMNKREYSSEKAKQRKDNVYTNISVAEYLISTMMIKYNFLIAKEFQKLGVPFMYRNNGSNRFDEYLKEANNLSATNKNYNSFINGLANLGSESYYSSVNEGHKGLKLKVYTHATNPLRSYASIKTQILLKHYLIDKNDTILYQKENIDKLCNYLNNKIYINNLYKIEATKEYKRKKSIDFK